MAPLRGILYSTGEYSYILLRNIKTARDTFMLAGEYPYSSLGNIKTFWEYPTFFRADGKPTLLGESIVDLFIVASLN